MNYYASIYRLGHDNGSEKFQGLFAKDFPVWIQNLQSFAVLGGVKIAAKTNYSMILHKKSMKVYFR